MNLTALRNFHEVAKCGSIRQAAERVHVAASALSRQITMLEHTFGAPLLERRASGVSLTPAGRLLAQHTRSMFRDLQRLQSEIDDLQSLRRGEIKLFVIEAIVSDLLPETIADFQAQYPNISFSVDIAGSDRILEAVIADEADIGIVYFANQRPEVEIVGRYYLPSHAVVAPSHPLAGRSRVELPELFEQRLALPDASFGSRKLVDEVARKHGLSISEILCTNSFTLMKGLARTGRAVAMLPTILVRQEVAAGQLCAIPVNDPDLASAAVEIGVHRNRAIPAAAQEFLGYLLQHVSGASLATQPDDEGSRPQGPAAASSTSR